MTENLAVPSRERLTPCAHRCFRTPTTTAPAGTAITASQLDVAEITDATPYSELLAYEALGLCGRANWAADLASGRFGRDGSLPVNLSGGVSTYNPVFCNGLIRIAEIANQVRGKAGNHQRAGAKLGIAHAGSGPAMQYQAAIILGTEQGARA